MLLCALLTALFVFFSCPNCFSFANCCTDFVLGRFTIMPIFSTYVFVCIFVILSCALLTSLSSLSFPSSALFVLICTDCVLGHSTCLSFSFFLGRRHTSHCWL
uniref:Secreted protein n=1 Tax=Ixodes ricinus TaxID=34613 RepID=A0A6B0UFJ6_IXORI